MNMRLPSLPAGRSQSCTMWHITGQWVIYWHITRHSWTIHNIQKRILPFTIQPSTLPGLWFINQLISPAVHDCLQWSRISQQALWHSVYDRYNWINHDIIKTQSKQKQIIITHGVFYCRKLPFSGIIHAPICNGYARKIEDYVLKLVCCF